jgi:hypothetical protein
MKTASALIVVVAATICSVYLLGRPGISAVAAQSSESHDARTSESSLQQKIVAKEREGLDALKAGNLELFGSLTADDAVFVDTQGPASKAQVLKNVAGFRLTEYSIEDVRFVPISSKSGLISYKISEKGVSHGKDFAAQVYVSSVWAKRAGQWVCLFSQETAAK